MGYNTPMPEAIKAQIRSMRSNGNLNYVGGHLWQGSKDTTNMLAYLTSSEGPHKTRAIGTDDVHELFADAIDEAVNGKDGKYGMLSSPSSHVMVEQLPDSAGGIPNIRVHTLVNGEPRQALIAGASIFALADRKRDKIKQGGTFAKDSKTPVDLSLTSPSATWERMQQQK